MGDEDQAGDWQRVRGGVGGSRGWVSSDEQLVSVARRGLMGVVLMMGGSSESSVPIEEEQSMEEAFVVLVLEEAS